MAVRVIVRAIFGARGQVVVGASFVVATAFQAWWWGIHSKPSTSAIFWLSIEALFFAGYNVIPTALGWRTGERIEARVADVEHAEEVDVG